MLRGVEQALQHMDAEVEALGDILVRRAAVEALEARQNSICMAPRQLDPPALVEPEPVRKSSKPDSKQVAKTGHHSGLRRHTQGSRDRSTEDHIHGAERVLETTQSGNKVPKSCPSRVVPLPPPLPSVLDGAVGEISTRTLSPPTPRQSSRKSKFPVDRLRDHSQHRTCVAGVPPPPLPLLGSNGNVDADIDQGIELQDLSGRQTPESFRDEVGTAHPVGRGPSPFST